MGSAYEDPLNSSVQSRETDSEQRWEAGGSRVRLLCSFGGKIQLRAHDNQLSYVGGDTKILTVDRNIRFSSMVGKLSSLWKSSISFKYQLPNEDLDALVSVSNDEDMENMMAEYDRLQKIGGRSSRLRLFVFPNKPDGDSSRSNSGLDIGPVSRSETALQGPPVSNMPDFLFDGVEDDRNSGKRGYAGQETDCKKQKVQSAPNSPMIGHSSIDSTASTPATINTVGSPHDFNWVEVGGNNVFARNTVGSPHHFNWVEVGGNNVFARSDLTEHLSNSTSADSRPILEIVARNSNEQAPQRPLLQVPIQELQKLQLRQLQDPTGRVDNNNNLSIQGRRKSSPYVRVVNSSSPDMTRPNPTLNESYILSNPCLVDSPTRTFTQDPNQVETRGNLGHNFELNSIFSQSVLIEHPFTVNPKPSSNSTPTDSKPVSKIVAGNSNEQASQTLQLQVPIQELQKLRLRQQQDPSTHPVDNNANLNIQGRKNPSDSVKAMNSSSSDMTTQNPTLKKTNFLPNSHPIHSTIENMTLMDPRKIELNQPYTPRYQHNPSVSEYSVNGQGSHFLARNSWQMHEPHGGQLSKYHPVHFVHGASPTLQPMTTSSAVGQPAAVGTGGYYNPGQRGTAPVPVPVPVTSEVRVVYRPSPPVPLGPYEPSSRPVYYMQAPPVPSPHYDSTTVNPVDFHDNSPSEKSKEQLGSSGSRGQ